MTTTDGRPRQVVGGSAPAAGAGFGVAEPTDEGRHARADPDAPGTGIPSPGAPDPRLSQENYVPRHAKVDPAEAASLAGSRVRVVLAERRAHPRTVRTLAEVEEQTSVGKYLVDGLMKAQLGLAARLGAVAVITLCSLPLLFATLPQLTELNVVGIRLPWLLLGVLAYPFLLLLGWLHTRAAERNERDFAEVVED